MLFTDARLQSADYISSLSVIACYNATGREREKEREQRKKVLGKRTPEKTFLGNFLAVAISFRADLHDTILSHATSSRQTYEMTYDCRSVLKHVLKCYDIFSDVHNNRKSCRGPVVSRCRMRQSRTV